MRHKALEIGVQTHRLPLSRAAAQALKHLERYDRILFTSKHAVEHFAGELQKRHIAEPPPSQIAQAGPRNELLQLAVSGKRLLFPRSAIAPFDIVRRLRAKGACVRVVPLYATVPVPLTKAEYRALLKGFLHALGVQEPVGSARTAGAIEQKRAHDGAANQGAMHRAYHRARGARGRI